MFDADGLTADEMQAVAREFDYSETTFVLAPDDPDADPAADHRVRIFTPTFEMPFAGHPNVGTGHALALRNPSAQGFVFEEIAGRVAVSIRRDGEAIHVEIAAPEPLSTGPSAPTSQVADCIGLDASEIVTANHEPCVASVGVAFTMVEIADRAALSRLRVADAAKLAALGGFDSVYAYTRDAAADGTDISARMIFDANGIREDPATGSATAACAALLHSLTGESGLSFAQGIDMGRPSLIHTRVDAGATYIGGTCVPVMEGTITL